MNTAAVYDLGNSMVLRTITATKASDISLNYNAAQEGVVEAPLNHDVFRHQDRWRVASGELVQKTQLTFSSSAQVFPADSVTELAVTVTEVTTPVWISTGGGKVLVTSEDNIVVLTSNIPKLFTLRLPPGGDPNYWSEFFEAKAV